MAMSSLPNNETINLNDDYLEIFSLVWIDFNINIEDNQEILEKLRSIINHIKIFENPEECEKYIKQRSKNDRIVVIINEKLAEQLIPTVHKLRQVLSIYIHWKDNKMNEQWINKFNKIKVVENDMNNLICHIKEDFKIQNKIEEPLSITMFSTSDTIDRSTKELNGEFVFSQLLIDCLLRMKSNEIDKNELIQICQNEYQNNKTELKKIKEFSENYSSEKALWWYTRESFFYKMLNKALRSQNIHMIFLFRSFIVDIRRQLASNQNYIQGNSTFRSQLMSIEELDNLKQYVGQFISINSFLSTSGQRSTALFLMGDRNDGCDLQRVLFEIKADPNLISTKPFGDIHKHSDFPEEDEVLFMPGSIFRLDSVNYDDKNHIWIIQMNICNDDQHEFQQVFTYMRKQNGTGETNLQRLSKLLWKMGKLDLAQIYLNRLLNQISSNDPLCITLYGYLGEIASLKGDYNLSIKYHQKSLSIEPSSTLIVNQNIYQTNNFRVSSIIINIDPNSRWTQNGVDVAGKNEFSDWLNGIHGPFGFCIDNENETMFIADLYAKRILHWKIGQTNGQVVIGENEHEDLIEDLGGPTAVIIDKQTDSLIICDWVNHRVVQWPRRDGIEGKTLISDINCWGVAIGNDGVFYVSDMRRNEVRGWKRGDIYGRIVAGGNGQGNNLNQLDDPRHLFIDQDDTLYVADSGNHRVVKWVKDATEGIVVAGGNRCGNALSQLCNPQSVIVDQLGTVYVADNGNYRIVRWRKDATEGDIIISPNDQNSEEHHLYDPMCLSFDLYGNIYVAYFGINRIQRFSLIKDS